MGGRLVLDGGGWLLLIPQITDSCALSSPIIPSCTRRETSERGVIFTSPQQFSTSICLSLPGPPRSKTSHLDSLTPNLHWNEWRDMTQQNYGSFLPLSSTKLFTLQACLNGTDVFLLIMNFFVVLCCTAGCFQCRQTSVWHGAVLMCCLLMHRFIWT